MIKTAQVELRGGRVDAPECGIKVRRALGKLRVGLAIAWMGVLK